MNLTHCKHNVPMEVDCLACEIDAANNAGAGIPSSDDPSLARMERHVKELQVTVRAREAEIVKLLRLADKNRLEAEKAQSAAYMWRDAALSLARAIGSYAETGRIE